MAITIRKNKGYTSIIINDISEHSFMESFNTQNLIEGLSVIKPSKKALESFVKLHSLTLDKVKAGEEYKVLGTTYKVVRNLDYSRTGSNEWYPIVKYFDRNKQDYVEFGIISTDIFAYGVLEHSFENLTGKLLYY